MQTFSTVFCLYCKLFLVLGFDFQKNNQNYLNQFLVLKETFFNPVHAKHINNEPFSGLYPFLILLKTLISNNFHNFETLRGSFVVTGSQNPNHNLRLCVSSGIIMIKPAGGLIICIMTHPEPYSQAATVWDDTVAHYRTVATLRASAEFVHNSN